MSNPQQTHFFTWCKGQVQIILGITPDESTDIVNSWVKLSDKELDSTLKVSLQKFNNYFFFVPYIVLNTNNALAWQFYLWNYFSAWFLKSVTAASKIQIDDWITVYFIAGISWRHGSGQEILYWVLKSKKASRICCARIQRRSTGPTITSKTNTST